MISEPVFVDDPDWPLFILGGIDTVVLVSLMTFPVEDDTIPRLSALVPVVVDLLKDSVGLASAVISVKVTLLVCSVNCLF